MSEGLIHVMRETIFISAFKAENLHENRIRNELTRLFKKYYIRSENEAWQRTKRLLIIKAATCCFARTLNATFSIFLSIVIFFLSLFGPYKYSVQDCTNVFMGKYMKENRYKKL
jgi:hypothetical protein